MFGYAHSKRTIRVNSYSPFDLVIKIYVIYLSTTDLFDLLNYIKNEIIVFIRLLAIHAAHYFYDF